jgi:hypothetical protein
MSVVFMIACVWQRKGITNLHYAFIWIFPYEAPLDCNGIILLPPAGYSKTITFAAHFPRYMNDE